MFFNPGFIINPSFMNPKNYYQQIADENVRLKQLPDRFSDGFMALNKGINYIFALLPMRQTLLQPIAGAT
jgi:hypothetical protein